MPLSDKTSTTTIGGSTKCVHAGKVDSKHVVIDLDDSIPPHTIRIFLCDDCWSGFVNAVNEAEADASKIVKVS